MTIYIRIPLKPNCINGDRQQGNTTGPINRNGIYIIYPQQFQSIVCIVNDQHLKVAKHGRERCFFTSGRLCLWRHEQGRHMWQVYYVTSQTFSGLHWWRANPYGCALRSSSLKGGEKYFYCINIDRTTIGSRRMKHYTLYVLTPGRLEFSLTPLT